MIVAVKRTPPPLLRKILELIEIVFCTRNASRITLCGIFEYKFDRIIILSGYIGLSII